MGESMQNLGAKFLKSESGATAIEYGFLVALISVAIIVVLQNFSNAFIALLATLTNILNNTTASP